MKRFLLSTSVFLVFALAFLFVPGQTKAQEVAVEAPGAFGTFFRGITESISLFFTFDDEKQIEKELGYIEEYTRFLETVDENSSEAEKRRAQTFTNRIERMVADIESRGEEWMQNEENETRFQETVQQAAERSEQAGNKSESLVQVVADGLLALPEKYTDDKDRDGLTDAQEALYGTSPTRFDTDGDGLSDGVEVTRWTSDPLSLDTDGDSYPDGIEVINGFNPVGDGVLPDRPPVPVRPNGVFADITGDGVVNVADTQCFVLVRDNGRDAECFQVDTELIDLDCDGVLSGEDIDRALSVATGGGRLPSELDADGDDWLDCHQQGVRPLEADHPNRPQGFDLALPTAPIELAPAQ